MTTCNAGFERAQSETIGVVFLTGVVVLLAGAIGIQVLGQIDQTSEPTANVEVNVSASTLELRHQGGDALGADEVRVVLADGGDAEVGLDAFTEVQGSNPDSFAAGERWSYDHSASGTLRVLLVYEGERDAALLDERFDVPTLGAPVARFTYAPSAPGTGETVSVDASESSYGGGTVASYEWDWTGDGSYEGSGETATHTYGSAGSYDLTLRVTGNDGTTATRTKTVTVNDPPSPSFTVTPAVPEVGESASFDATGSSDPDGTVASYEWDWDDDGTYEASGATATHSYGSGGSHEVTLRVTDDDGATATTTRTVEVNPPPSASFTYGCTWGECDVDASGSSDDGTITSYEWDWTDDSSFEGTGQTASHTYPTSGTYDVVLRVTDDHGATATTTQSVTVDNVAPDAALSVSPSGPDTKTNLSLDGSGSSDADGSIVAYEFDLGDGLVLNRSDPSLQYTYDCAGTYTANLTVYDDDGATNSTAVSVSVSGADRDVVAALNSGGPAHTSCEGVDYRDGTGDTYLVQGANAYGDGSYPATNGTSDDILYQTEHWDGNTVEYGVPLSAGTYRVELKFAEIYFGNDGPAGSGQRVFDVAVEGRTVATDLDIYDRVGPNTRLDLNETVVVTDGGLNITLTNADANNPKLSAFVIEDANEPISWTSATDWDAAAAASGIVHAGYGDRQADQLELGYDASDGSLLGYWPLDDGPGGTAVDASGNGHDGTQEGVTTGGTGIFGTSSYEFLDDGGGSWVELPGFPDRTASFTVSAWIRTDDRTEGGQRVFADDGDNTGGYALSLADQGGTGRLRFYSRDVNPIILDSGPVIENGRWYHVAAVHDASTSTRRIYVNGTQVAADTYSGNWGTDVDAAAIGGEIATGESENRFDGDIDEVRYTSTARSAADIREGYETGFEGTLTTGWKTFESDVGPDRLNLTSIQATRPAGTTVNLTVESDPDGDGDFEETSDTVTLDGSASYEVDGLATASARYRLVVTLSAGAPTATPTVEGVTLAP